MPELKVTVNRVAFPRVTEDPDGWKILITDRGCCKGKVAWRPEVDEQLILEGEWTVYHGEKEFSFKSARLDLPTDPRDQLRYVCARTKGLGSAAEEAIWLKKGLNWAELEPTDVPRISDKIFQAFLLQLEGLINKGEESRVVAALMGKGATMNMAVSAWTKWEKDTLGVVHSDCYRLAELDSYGFQDVDKKIRREYDIEDADPRRIRSGIVYALRRLTDRGDTVVDWHMLFKTAIGVLGGFNDLVSDQTSAMFKDGTLKGFGKSKGVSLSADYKAEIDVWEFVEKRAG